MFETKRPNSASGKNKKIDNLYYSTIQNSKKNIQEILNKYAYFSQKKNKNNISSISYHKNNNFSLNNNNPSLRLLNFKTNTNYNNYLNGANYYNYPKKNTYLLTENSSRNKYKITPMEGFFDLYSKKIQSIKNLMNETPKQYSNINYPNKDYLYPYNQNKNKEYFPSPNFSNYNIETNTFSFINNKNLLDDTEEILFSRRSSQLSNNNNKINNYVNNITSYNSNNIKENISNNNNYHISKNNSTNSSKEITLSYFDFANNVLELIDQKKSFFVYMFGSINSNGLSWCKDCNIASPNIQKGKKMVLNKNILWVNIPIDKEKKYVYKYNNYLKMDAVPTLIYFKNGFEIGRIIQQDLFDENYIINFILKCL